MGSGDSERERWNERYRSGQFSGVDAPARLVRDAIAWLPAGRALDVATGTGRHALYLAEHGHSVDAIDISEEGLRVARQRERERGLKVNWIQADLTKYPLSRDTYHVIVIVGYSALDLLESLKASLVPGGILLYEHHLQPAARADRGPRSDRYRYRSNELLHACLDLTILDYRELTRTDREDGSSTQALTVSMIARKPTPDIFFPPGE